MQTNICCIYLSGPKKTTNNLLRILSHILPFMLLQNKYKKCDYCLLLLSSFCVLCGVCSLPYFVLPLLNDPVFQACPSPGRQAGTQQTLHKHKVGVFCTLVLSCLGSSYLVLFSIVFSQLVSCCRVFSCLVLSWRVFSCLVLFMFVCTGQTFSSVFNPH